MITIEEFKKNITKKSRLLGLDLGTKRIGIAISDSSSIIASPLCTISNQEIFKFLEDLFKNEVLATELYYDYESGEHNEKFKINDCELHFGIQRNKN